jgi:2-polyprenyl-3-methyl-5-hydroxy-6-metoxy-1,4-benzoquinol methylase
MVHISVKDFYENEGWQFSNSNSYDAVLNENLSEVASHYVSKVRMRIKAHLGEGKNLLDIGCGPIQYEEYVSYSEMFNLRICVDLSEKALKVAEQRIGLKGRYFVGDYLTIPTLEFAPYDGATLINVLYHVDKDLQSTLVRKVLSELSPGKKLVIVYSNSSTLSALVTQILVKLKHLLLQVFGRKMKRDLANPIYFYRHNSKFWKQFSDDASIEILTWRTFSPPLERLIFRRLVLGRLGLRILFRLEQVSLWAKLAEYPMIVLTKNLEER